MHVMEKATTFAGFFKLWQSDTRDKVVRRRRALVCRVSGVCSCRSER